MCAPLISRDGQQQSRGVNSCIRVLIIAVMRSLCSRASPSPFKSVTTKKGAGRAAPKRSFSFSCTLVKSMQFRFMFISIIYETSYVTAYTPSDSNFSWKKIEIFAHCADETDAERCLSGFLASVSPFKWRYHHRRWRRPKLTKETGTLRRHAKITPSAAAARPDTNDALYQDH